MTPAEQLAAARSNVVGPYIPATEALLAGWCGPVEWFDGDGWRVDTFGLISGPGRIRTYGIGRFRLDLRREEVRDHLVRRGAPAWARDVPPALWVWATMGTLPDALCQWYRSAQMMRKGLRDDDHWLVYALTDGWKVYALHGLAAFGPETGPEGMACADLAALRAGCILEEPDGWLVPTPDGGIGFWPKS